MKKIITIIFCAIANLASAQERSLEIDRHDALFPGRKNFNAGILLTYTPVAPPPVLIGEVTYGISNRLTVGIVGGTTGALALYGGKINAVLVQRENFRASFRMLSLYYPERNGKFLFDRREKYVMPWMLSMAVIDGEWKLKNGIRFSGGAGVLETHCMAGLKMWMKGYHSRSELGGSPIEFAEFLDLFTVAHTSVSVPLTRRLTLRPEVFTVFKNGRLIKREEFRVALPVNAYVGLTYSF